MDIDTRISIMIKIPLTQNQITIIDDCDADLAELKWCAKKCKTYQFTKFNAIRSIKNVNNRHTTMYLHRVILSRVLKRELKSDELVDHINGNPLDNRRCNLRLSTHSTNAMNRFKTIKNKSGYKGVVWSKKRHKWEASIRKDGKLNYLGGFDTPELAYEAYCKAAKELHGEYAHF